MKNSIVLVGALLVLLAMVAMSSTTAGAQLGPFLGADLVHNAMRLLMALAIVILLFTVRPRHIIIRAALGTMASVIVAVAVTQAAAYALPILDALAYVAVAIGLMVEALEEAPAPQVTFQTAA